MLKQVVKHVEEKSDKLLFIILMQTKGELKITTVAIIYKPMITFLTNSYQQFNNNANFVKRDTIKLN